MGSGVSVGRTSISMDAGVLVSVGSDVGCVGWGRVASAVGSCVQALSARATRIMRKIK